MMRDAFDELLARLAEQHRRDLAAATEVTKALQVENQQLKKRIAPKDNADAFALEHPLIHDSTSDKIMPGTLDDNAATIAQRGREPGVYELDRLGHPPVHYSPCELHVPKTPDGKPTLVVQRAWEDIKDSDVGIDEAIQTKFHARPSQQSLIGETKSMRSTVETKLSQFTSIHARKGHDVRSIIGQIAGLKKLDNSDEFVSARDFHQIKTESQDALSRRLMLLNGIVSLTVVLSFTCLGISLDNDPMWNGWIAIEGCFAAIFLAEISIKIKIFGLHGFFWGSDRIFNRFDAAITALAVLDLIVALATLSNKEDLGLSSAKPLVLVRALRIARITRLAKLLRNPLFQQLLEMLSGFAIGIPWLFWVLVLLFVIIYSLGLFLRQMFGQDADLNLVAQCGRGDAFDAADDASYNPPCKIHYLYAEEFFGSVMQSMFTVFRCVIGDCSTEAGRSLITIMTRGYGIWSQLAYAMGMIIVIFGLFNVITAIFVEATITGLKTNTLKRKYTRLHEAQFLHRALMSLLRRMHAIHASLNKQRISQTQHEFDCSDSIILECAVSDTDFLHFMVDPQINDILDDLDIGDQNRDKLFDLMEDMNEDGKVSLLEVVKTLVKLRGTPQKKDMVEMLNAMTALQEKFTYLRRLSS